MSPHDKAVKALNDRLDRLQVNLLEARSDAARQFLFQSLVVTAGMGAAMNDYIQKLGTYAQRRHGTFKDSSGALRTRHGELLQLGQDRLEQFKAAPKDRALRHEIEAAQRDMTAIQKKLRRGAYDLQRELALCMAMIDKLAESVRRICEADQADAMKRALKQLIGHVHALYTALESTPAMAVVDAAAWEKSAAGEIDQATDPSDAYARCGYQAMVGLELMNAAIADIPPQTAEEATQRANEAVSTRIKELTSRFTTAP